MGFRGQKKHMEQYLNLLQTIKSKGTWKSPAREGMPKTLSLFGAQYRCKLSDGFPILTTKEVNFKSIVTELLWFLRGDTNIKYLVDNGCNIWNEDAYNYYCKLGNAENDGFKPISFENFIMYVKSGSFIGGDYSFGDCGNQYGKLWRDWDGIDQISELIKGLEENPESRRHILTALNPAKYNDLALFPCHVLAQFNCRPLNNDEKLDYLGIKHSKNDSFNADLIDNTPKYYLDCSMYQRSCDVFLGVPYNTASYALLTHILSEICGMIPGDLIHTFGDVHIYENHMEQVDDQLNRTPNNLPKLLLNKDLNWKCYEHCQFDTLRLTDFSLSEYNPQSKIKAKLSTGLR